MRFPLRLKLLMLLSIVGISLYGCHSDPPEDANAPKAPEHTNSKPPPGVIPDVTKKAGAGATK